MKRESVTCECKQPSGERRSLFRDILVLNWYDGIVDGVAFCARCGRRFLCTCRKIDSLAKLRDYTCGEMSDSTFRELLKAFGLRDTPVEGVVIPPDSQAARERMNFTTGSLNQIVGSIQPPFVLICAETLDKQWSRVRIESTDEYRPRFRELEELFGSSCSGNSGDQ